MKKKKVNPDLLPVGAELIYSDLSTQMELTTITKVENEQYHLSNGIVLNSQLIRVDHTPRMKYDIKLATEENKLILEAYFAHQFIRTNLPKLQKFIDGVDKMNPIPEEVNKVLKFKKYLLKIIDKCL